MMPRKSKMSLRKTNTRQLVSKTKTVTDTITASAGGVRSPNFQYTMRLMASKVSPDNNAHRNHGVGRIQ